MFYENEVEAAESFIEKEIIKASERKSAGRLRHNFQRKPTEDYRAMRKMKLKK